MTLVFTLCSNNYLAQAITLGQSLMKHNTQYPSIEVKTFAKSHDRFLIIDNQTVYHIGASLMRAA